VPSAAASLTTRRHCIDEMSDHRGDDQSLKHTQRPAPDIQSRYYHSLTQYQLTHTHRAASDVHYWYDHSLAQYQHRQVPENQPHTHSSLHVRLILWRCTVCCSGVYCRAADGWALIMLCTDLDTTTVLRPFFRDHLGKPVPEENFWTLWCKGRLT